MSKKDTSWLFWQPSVGLLKYFENSPFSYLLIILNYIIWPFLFYISILLIKVDINNLLHLFIATFFGEIIEKYGKNYLHFKWQRPFYNQETKVPKGLVNRYYQAGSFPSGHTIKTTYFFLFLILFPVFNPTLFLLITVPLLIFRVSIGFHYPIDIIGGFFIGMILFFISRFIFFSPQLAIFFNTCFSKIFYAF